MRIKTRIMRLLNADRDLIPFRDMMEKKGDEKVVQLLDSGGGHLLRGTSPMEDIIKTIFTCNANWPYSVRMASDFCSDYGVKCSCCQTRAFPDSIDIPANIMTKVGYRKKVIHNALAAMARIGELIQRKDYEELHSSLLGINGIGTYSAAHIMNLMGDYGHMPVDREMADYLGIPYSRTAHKAIQEKFEQDYGEWAFLAYKMKRIAHKTNWIGD